MEHRLKKRESELLSQLESSQMNSKLERSRIVSQHELELLEKDEQFLRFQNEMEYIVQMLRQTQTQTQGVGVDLGIGFGLNTTISTNSMSYEAPII